METSSGNYKIFLIILYMNGVSSAHHKVAASTPYFYVTLFLYLTRLTIWETRQKLCMMLYLY